MTGFPNYGNIDFVIGLTEPRILQLFLWFPQNIDNIPLIIDFRNLFIIDEINIPSI